MATVKEMIEKRAYELYLKRGGVHGNAAQDWQQAEKEILAELAAGKKTESRASAGPAAALGAAPSRAAPAESTATEKPKLSETKPLKAQKKSKPR